MTKALAIIGFTLALEAGFLLQASIPAAKPASAVESVAGQPPAGAFAVRAAPAHSPRS